MTKAEQRRLITERLKQFPESDRLASSERITAKIIALASFQSARCVALYAAMASEPRTHSLFLAATQRVVYPRVEPGNARLTFYQVRTTDDFARGQFGIMEPNPERCAPVPVAEIDFVLVPGVAFDHQRARLGRGGGYYDRLLEELMPSAARIGCFFACQEVDHVEREPHDQVLDRIITEREEIA